MANIYVIHLPMGISRYTLLVLFFAVLSAVKAQGEIEIDWSAYAKDTVVPTFTHCVELGYDYEGEYSVTIEYPELKPLANEEASRYGLPQKEGMPEWPEVMVDKGISAKRGQLDVSFVPIIWRDGRYWRIESFVLKVYREALAQRISRANEVARHSSHSVLSAGYWVKIRVAENGIYMLTHAYLKSLGFDSPEAVRLYGYGGHLLSESDVKDWRDDLCEVPLWREADRVLFYANGSVRWKLESDRTFTHTRNPYSDYGYYFLTEDTVAAPAVFPMVEEVETPQQNLVTTTPAYALHEVDDYAWYSGGRKLVESYDYQNGKVRMTGLVTSGVDSIKEAVLDVCFTQNAAEATTLTIAINDSTYSMRLNPIDTHSKAYSTTSSIVVSLEEDTDVQYFILAHRCPAKATGRLDYLRLNYTRTLGLNMPIYATSSGTVSYVVPSVNERTVVWDVTDATSPRQIPTTLEGDELRFSATGKMGNVYVAIDTRADYPMPEEVAVVGNQDLHATAATDYIIIVPANGELTMQAERLAEAHRQSRGLTVKVVRADEVYNEFSSGTPDATAYRRYLKMLYDRAKTVEDAPKYLLLFGDGAWDNRMLSVAWKGQSPDDYLLCYEDENSVSTTSSYVVEDYFGFLDDGEGANLKKDKMDIGVGRFPITTVSQAREVVDKIITYIENTHAGAWKNSILMLGDDGDANRHMDDAEFVAQMLESEYPGYMVKRIYWDAFPMEKNSTGNSYPAVRKRLLELFKEGALMINYSGHGAPDVLSHELVINKTDVAQVRSPRPPVWVTSSCDVTPFDNSVSSFGEYAFLNPYGGAIGLLTSTRTTYAAQNRRINYLFTKYTFARDENNRRLSLGDALRMAKCAMITSGDPTLRDVSGNKLNYVLLGDPALVVGAADYQMVVDELNGVALGEDDAMLLKAGSQVVVKGHVNTLDSVLASNFTGVLYASVFDNVEEVTCRNNAKAKDVTPFVYRDRTKKFFVGSDSVRNGEFTFTFRVPMDMNYSKECGLINMYAVDSTRTQEAKGAFEGFLLGGTEDNLINDGTGPQIQLYLNSTDFVSGDKVNETPRLVAILEDPDGINTAGNLGHNLVAIIDGEASMTYNLNEYYVSDIGGYTRGMITYVLPELSEGKHTMMLRAWDMMNNSSSTTIEFEVVKGLSPSIIETITMPNPARDNVTFMFTHDRPENEVQVTFEVFDFSGRILWNHSEVIVSPDNTYTFTWNLCGAAGQPLKTGVYLYRIIVASPTGQSESKAQKMLIRR